MSEPVTRTFTVLIREEYNDGVVLSESEAFTEMRDRLQESYEVGAPLGTNFIILDMQEGDVGFWKLWGRRLNTQGNNPRR